VILDTTY